MLKRIYLIAFVFLTSCTQSETIYTLSASVNPSEGGTVQPLSQDYPEGSTAVVVASASDEYQFDYWTGDIQNGQLDIVDGRNVFTVVMDSDKNVVANFVKKKYALTVKTEGEGSITEKVIKAGAATDYNSGTVLELTAVPGGEWLFVEWTGDLTGSENPKEITIDKPKTVTAVFVKKQYPLTIEIEGEGTVTETVIKQGLATDYNSGTIVELTAIPKEKWEFKEWEQDLTGNDNPTQITMTSSLKIKAVFKLIDSDGDGVKDSDDCSPFDSDIYPGNTEICDGKDNDCDGVVDNNFGIRCQLQLRIYSGEHPSDIYVENNEYQELLYGLYFEEGVIYDVNTDTSSIFSKDCIPLISWNQFRGTYLSQTCGDEWSKITVQDLVKVCDRIVRNNLFELPWYGNYFALNNGTQYNMVHLNSQQEDAFCKPRYLQFNGPHADNKYRTLAIKQISN